MSLPGTPAIEVAARISHLEFTTTDYEFPFEARRTDEGPILTEYAYDDDDYRVIDGETKRVITDLVAELADWIDSYREVVEVTVTGVSPEKLWLLLQPLLPETQEELRINGEWFVVQTSESDVS